MVHNKARRESKRNGSVRISSSKIDNALVGKKGDENLVLLGLRSPTIESLDRKPCMIYPNDKYEEMFWDSFMAIILLITCFITPINLAFSEETEEVQWYVVFNYVIDFLFACDIIVNFNCATQNEAYDIDDDRYSIAKKYLKGWFIIDTLAIMPFSVIIGAFSGSSEIDTLSQSETDIQANQFVRVARLSKLYKLVKITRLFRLFKFMQNKNKAVKKLNSAMKMGMAFERLAFFLLVLVLLSHFIGCFWGVAGLLLLWCWAYEKTAPRFLPGSSSCCSAAG